MIPDIYYVNSENEKIDLLKPPYLLQAGTIMDSKWAYESKETRTGGKITSIKKSLEEKSLTLSIINFGRDSYERAIDNLYETFEKDVLNKSPGRLYVGNMYLECYVFSSEKSEWESDAELMDVNLTVVAENPIWVGEDNYTFHSYGISSDDNKRYPGRYPYRYANGLTSNYIVNPHYTEANFEMIIYGPVINPQVTMGTNTYLVNIVLEEGEYLQINSRDRTIVKVLRNGERANAYHYRQKGREFFQKIQPGRQMIQWTGKFNFDLTVYEERSEPKWNVHQAH